MKVPIITRVEKSVVPVVSVVIVVPAVPVRAKVP
tara:strand:- start:397 stop:498 length:102 start_codon:yes stop_codon:yes gene_type:complete